MGIAHEAGPVSTPSVFHHAEQEPLTQFTRVVRKPNMGGAGVDFIMGFREDGGSAVQSIHFNVKNFSAAHAATWLRERHIYRDGVQPAPEAKVVLSFEKITELVRNALREAYPPIMRSGEESGLWDHRYHIVKIWGDSVLVRKAEYCSLDTDPAWGFISYSIDENAEPSIRLGEFEPMKLRAVAIRGERTVDLDENDNLSGEGDHLEEAGKRNAKADAQSINAAIRALANLLNDDDVDEDTLTAISAKRPPSKTKEGADVEPGAVAEAFSDQPWDGSKSRFSIEQLMRSVPRAMAAWARSQAAKEKREVTKDDCHLPYKETDGTINLAGVRNALARVGQVGGVPGSVKSAARAELERALARGNKAQNKEASEVTDPPIVEGWAQLPGETFTETFAMQMAEGKFDKEAMVLRDVVVLGPVSSNGRRYSVETQRDAILLFEGAKAYLNHPHTRDLGEARDVQDLIGEHKNVRVVGDRTISDLYLINNQTVREHVVPIVESKPHLAGNSIVARGKMVKADDGIMDVEKILAVRSVDLVAEPATTNGIFAESEEHKETDMDWQTITVEMLRKERADLVDVILASAKEKEHVTQLEAQVATLDAQVKERDEKLATLELTTVKNEREAEIARRIREAKLPDSAKYEEKDGTRVIKAHWLSMMERCRTAEEMGQLVMDWEASFKGAPTPLSEHKDPLAPAGADALSEAALLRLYRAAA